MQAADPHPLLGLAVDGPVVDTADLAEQRHLRLLRIERSDSSSQQDGVELGLPHLRLLQVRRASVLGSSLKLNVRPQLLGHSALCGADM
jgi:hypothetical protein